MYINFRDRRERIENALVRLPTYPILPEESDSIPSFLPSFHPWPPHPPPSDFEECCAKMSETNDGEASFAEYPSQTAYTEAIPIRCVAPEDSNKNKRKPTPNKTTSSKPKKQTVRKNHDTDIDETQFDFSNVPPPVCSCTGVARQCHKCGVNGWQSSCCNSKMSVFPLPMSPWRPGARVGGRKMSHGAYRKLLCRLAAEGHNLSHPVDLKAHWAKHGTNNFVTIK